MMAATASSTVRDALEAATDAIGAAGSDSARLDAELLLAEATGWERARLVAEPEAELPKGAAREFAAAVRRRVRREPVAYILGRKGFRGIELAVDGRALIPRPETELLVDVALELQSQTVLDVGTGSGAVALATAEELPEAEVTGTDTSPEALELARANAEGLGLADRVSFEQGSVPRGDFDLLLANLPYVSEAEWEGLEPEIREYEPRSALVAGPTGMEAIETLVESIGADARRPGAVALEVGAEQADRVDELVRGLGYPIVERRPDLAGIERMVLGRDSG